MGKTCHRCGKKLYALTGEQSVIIDGVTQDFCDDCFKLLRKQTLKK